MYTVSSGGLALGLDQHVIEYGLITCVPLAGHRPQRPLAGSAAPRPHACPRSEEWGLDWKVSDDPARQEAVAHEADLERWAKNAQANAARSDAKPQAVRENQVHFPERLVVSPSRPTASSG
jgi:hypothetical protein